MPPLISICLPSLNQRPFLEERMESILGQTLSDWELIVCDSYSEDGSWEFFQTFQADARVRLFQVPREGIYAGWNECLKHACGRYISISPADDTTQPDFLEKMSGALDAQPGVDLAVCQFDFIDHDGKVFDPPPVRRLDRLYDKWIDVPHRRPREADILTHLCVGIPWTTTSALVFRRTLVDKTGLFRTDCGPRADGLWSLKASLYSDSISLPGRMATWRRHPGQGSAQWERGWWRQAWMETRTLLQEHAEQIPEPWRRDPGWERELLAMQRTRYLRSLGVDRAEAREAPAQFVVNCARALFREPRFVLRRLLHGLPWNNAEMKDEYAHLHDLIEKWDVEWRPKVVGAHEPYLQQSLDS